MLNARAAPPRHPGLVVETIPWPGVGLIRGVASSPDGLLYALRGPCVYVMAHYGEFELYAGHPKRKGNQDGHRLSQACFEAPNGLYVTSSKIYICDTVSSVLRCISDEDVTTYAGTANTHGHLDGPRKQALFNGPSNVVLFRGILFVSDYRNNAIRMISADGIVSSIGGRASFQDGRFASAAFDQPSGLCVSPSNTVIVADSGNRRIRSIDMDEWTVTTIAGGGAAREDGTGTSAGFGTLSGITSSFATGELYLVDFSYNRIRCIDSAGNVSTLTGSSRGERDGPLATARLLCPDFCCLTPDGTLYWTEYDSSKLRCIKELSPQSVVITSTPFASFECLLEFGFSSDFELHYHHTTIPLHSHILLISNHKLKPEFLQEQLESCKVEIAVLRKWLRIVYGASQLHLSESTSTMESAATYAEFLILFHLLEYERKWIEWCQCRLAEQLVDLGVYSLFQLILKYAQDDVARESLIIPVILTRLKACKQEEIVQHRHTLYPLASSDLDVYSMILYQITGAAPVPAMPPDMSLDYLRKELHQVVKQMTSDLRWKHTRKSRNHHHNRHESRDSNSSAGHAANTTTAVTTATTSSGAVRSPPSSSSLLPESSANSTTYTASTSSNTHGHSSTPSISPSPSFYDVWQIDFPTFVPVFTPPPNFVVTISDSPGNRIKVHDWMLYARWGFFRRMCDSGMAETRTRAVAMPSDFPSPLLLELIKYIYSGTLPQSTVHFSTAACRYLLEHAFEFDFVDATHEPHPLFQPLISFCRAAVFYPLTISNAVAQVDVIRDLGSKRDFKFAINFLANNYDVIAKTPGYLQEADSIPREWIHMYQAIT